LVSSAYRSASGRRAARRQRQSPTLLNTPTPSPETIPCSPNIVSSIAIKESTMLRDPDHHQNITRRYFLKLSAALVGVLALPRGSLAATSLVRSVASPLRIGVALPQSRFYPTLGDSFLAGMHFFFSQSQGRVAGRTITLITEGYGDSPLLALQKTRDLLEQRQADVVVSALNSGVDDAMRALLHKRQTPLIISNAGANVLRSEQRAPQLITNSLNHWQSAWALGDWAAQHLGRRAFVASSFYDSGYDALYAFEIGFGQAKGTIVKTQISHLPTNTISMTDLMAAIRQTRPDFVYACYCGKPAVDFVRAYAASGLARQIPLVGSGFLVDENTLPLQGSAALGIRTVASWADSLNTPQNRAFVAAYQAYAKRPANSFAVLGYDTARLIADALSVVGGNTSNADAFQQALRGAAFTGPRGSVKMNPKTQELRSPLYLREVRGGSQPRNMIVGELAAAPGLNTDDVAATLGPKTGWLNAYLCV
jgi:branched-chain amino acid transport system substrate-binding protein